MRTGIATVSLSGVLEDKLAAAAGAGFDTVELFDNDLIASPTFPSILALIVQQRHREVALLHRLGDIVIRGHDILRRRR